ncbi:MAG TPA: SGNH/GDSL hydrolase family protein [Gammaproteobacteria bacterium]|nr:SGNH/GDSL hydrolase family protein [Gammaproteobacteria bacterium]
MMKRIFYTAILAAALIGFGTTGVLADDPRQPQVTNLWAFGDSLTDSGNLFFLSGNTEPPSPPYFNGRFSDGPTWIEPFAERLGLDIDFDIPFANNYAIGGAFTGFDGEAGPGLGVLSQVNLFLATVGSVPPDDLMVIWAGANDYFFINAPPNVLVNDAINNLATAVSNLALMGNARRFLVPNLPKLGDLPLARLQGDPAVVAGLNALTAAHNAALAETMANLSATLGVEIVIVNVNAALAELLTRQHLFGYDNVSLPCLIQQADGSRIPSGACPPDGASFDSTGVLFWDLVHPTRTAHELLAAFAHATLVASRGLPETVFDPERISTQIAIGKMRAAGATAAPRP